MRRSLVAALLLIALAGTACSSDSGPKTKAAIQPVAAESETSTTAVVETTTTTAAPATTTTTAPPPPLPQPVELAASGAKAALTASGVTVPIVGAQGADALVGTPCGRAVPLRQGFPIKDVAVVLDAGHGGVEPGAVGPAKLIAEKDLNLAVTKYAQAALEAAGHKVALTRTADYRVTLKARADIVKALQPKAFVSVHYNAEPDGPFPKPGVETYYQIASPDSKRLSGLIYEEVVKAVESYRLAWVADRDAGAKYRQNSSGGDYYGVLRLTNGTPATIAELGFISSPAEEAIYAKPEVQKVAGEAVAKGIVRYLTTPDPGSGFTEPYPRESPAGGGGGSNNCTDPAL